MLMELSLPPNSHGFNSDVTFDSWQKFSFISRNDSEWNRTAQVESITAKPYPGGSMGSIRDIGRTTIAWTAFPFGDRVYALASTGVNSAVVGDIPGSR